MPKVKISSISGLSRGPAISSVQRLPGSEGQICKTWACRQSCNSLPSCCNMCRFCSVGSLRTLTATSWPHKRPLHTVAKPPSPSWLCSVGCGHGKANTKRRGNSLPWRRCSPSGWPLRRQWMRTAAHTSTQKTAGSCKHNLGFRPLLPKSWNRFCFCHLQWARAHSSWHRTLLISLHYVRPHAWHYTLISTPLVPKPAPLARKTALDYQICLFCSDPRLKIEKETQRKTPMESKRNQAGRPICCKVTHVGKCFPLKSGTPPRHGTVVSTMSLNWLSKVADLITFFLLGNLRFTHL